MDGLNDVDVRKPSIHQRWSTIREDVQRLRRCRHIRNVSALGTGDEIGYVAKDAKRREVEQERTAEEFDVGYYRKLLEKAWDEVSFVSKRDN